MKIIFTNHSRDRMKKYSLSEEQVISALLEPDCVLEGKFGRKIAQRALDEKHLLRVIYEEREGVAIIVTCYKARKERYSC